MVLNPEIPDWRLEELALQSEMQDALRNAVTLSQECDDHEVVNDVILKIA